MARSFGAWLAVLVVLVASTTLGGCYLGPSPVQYAALAVVDGRATAFVASCRRSSVHLSLYSDEDSAGGPLHLWSVTVAVPDGAESVEVELLGAPRPGWEITSKENVGGGSDAPRVVPLTSLEPGRHYTLDSSESGPEGTSAPFIRFTTDVLSKIRAGEVLVPLEKKRVKSVPRQTFIDDRCH